MTTLNQRWSLGDITGNWQDIDLPAHSGVMRIVIKMECDEGPNPNLQAQAEAVALNAAEAADHGPSVAVGGYAELPEPTASIGVDDAWHEQAMRDFADRTHALRMQAAPQGSASRQSDKNLGTRRGMGDRTKAHSSPHSLSRAASPARRGLCRVA